MFWKQLNVIITYYILNKNQLCCDYDKCEKWIKFSNRFLVIFNEFAEFKFVENFPTAQD